MSEHTNNLLTILNPNYKTTDSQLKENIPGSQKNHLSIRARLQAKASPSQKVCNAFQEKPATQKLAQNQNQHRAGDWVCIMCHNHNYSFREVCNRCTVQTKMENLRQSLSYYQNQNYPTNTMFAQSFSEDNCNSVEHVNQVIKDSSIIAENKLYKLKTRAEKAENVGRIPFSDLTESINKEFPFEKQLYFSSEEYEDVSGEALEDEVYESTASSDHEKRILKFLNFD